MLSMLCASLVTTLVASPPPAHAATGLRGFGIVGVGLPEVIHAEAGGFATDRWSVEARYGNVIFNHMVGLGATGHLLGTVEDGGPPRHSLLVGPQLMLNPTLGELRIRGGGETIAALAGVAVGYGLRLDAGFLLRVRVPVFVYDDAGLAAGGGVSVGAGWGF